MDQEHNTDYAADPSTPPATMGSTKDDRNMAMLAHLLAIFTGFLGPLIIWLVKKESSAFVNDQGKEALNFQITVLIAYIISAALIFVVVGCVLVPAVMLADIILCILAAVAASKGEAYRYPVCLRLVK